MSKYSPILIILLWLLIWLCAGCSPLDQTSSPTTTSTPWVPPLTPRFGSATPTPTISSPAISVVTPTPSPQAIVPIVSRVRILPHSWSPSGNILVYWTFTLEEVKQDYLFPAGTMHFVDARSAQVCDIPYSVAYNYGGPSQIAWLSDGEILLRTGSRILRGTPCHNDFRVVSDLSTLPILGFSARTLDHSILLRTNGGYWLYEPNSGQLRPASRFLGGTNFSFSPKNNRLAVTSVVNSANFVAMTSIVDLETDQVVGQVRWKYFDTEGGIGSPQWLDDNQLLVPYSLDQGPLLVRLGSHSVQAVIQVAPELFGQPFKPSCNQDPCDTFLVATGAVLEGDSAYHLVLSAVGIPSEFPPISLYHSENGQVEQLASRDFAGFSPDGKWLGFFEPLLREDREVNLGLRPVDPPGSQAHWLTTTRSGAGRPTWSPDSTQLAVIRQEEVAVYSVPALSPINSWRTGDYAPLSMLWSPNGDFLAVQGGLNGSGEGLFIIKIQ